MLRIENKQIYLFTRAERCKISFNHFAICGQAEHDDLLLISKETVSHHQASEQYSILVLIHPLYTWDW